LSIFNESIFLHTIIRTIIKTKEMVLEILVRTETKLQLARFVLRNIIQKIDSLVNV